jgi:hypothetical protein
VQDLAKLSDLADAEIADLVAAGVTVSPRDIVAINALAWEIESPESRAALSRGTPVFIGTLALWPLTMYAADWYKRVGCKLLGTQAQTLALAYAMAYGRTEGALDIGRAQAELAVSRFGARLGFRAAELVEAIDQVLQQDAQPDEPPIKGGQSMSAGELSAFLVSAAGGPADMWERQASIGYIGAMINAIVAQNKADNKPSITDPRIRATRALAWYCECLKRPELREQQNG